MNTNKERAATSQPKAVTEPCPNVAELAELRAMRKAAELWAFQKITCIRDERDRIVGREIFNCRGPNGESTK